MGTSNFSYPCVHCIFPVFEKKNNLIKNHRGQRLKGRCSFGLELPLGASSHPPVGKTVIIKSNNKFALSPKPKSCTLCGYSILPVVINGLTGKTSF